MGARRHIDYILSSWRLSLNCAYSPCELDLGSDRRAAKAVTHCDTSDVSRIVRRRHPMHGWRPAISYTNAFNSALQHVCSRSLH